MEVGKSIADAVRDGRACPIRFIKCELLTSGKAVLLDAFAASVKELIGDRKTYVFVSDWATGNRVADELTTIGVRVATIDGRTTLGEANRVVQDLRDGSLQVVIGGEVLVMSPLNEPEVSCIVILRKTKSQDEYQQMVGRGIRLATGKRDCLVIDYTDA